MQQTLAKAGKAKKETFSFESSNAESIMLVGDFTDWERNAVPLKRQKNGTWKATVTLEPGTYEYRFIVDGEWQDDPNCPTRRANSFGAMNCVREVG
ncbi:MAG TPA: isoamylase early set domain-containing protein [Verrucomicrobiae bacterium]